MAKKYNKPGPKTGSRRVLVIKRDADGWWYQKVGGANPRWEDISAQKVKEILENGNFQEVQD